MVRIPPRGQVDLVEIFFKVFFVVMVVGIASAVVVGPKEVPVVATVPAETAHSAPEASASAPTAAVTDPCLRNPDLDRCAPPEPALPEEPRRPVAAPAVGKAEAKPEVDTEGGEKKQDGHERSERGHEARERGRQAEERQKEWKERLEEWAKEAQERQKELEERLDAWAKEAEAPDEPRDDDDDSRDGDRDDDDGDDDGRRGEWRGGDDEDDDD